MLTECSQDLLPVQVEKICERLSPSSNESCLPLSLFMDEHEPGMYSICLVHAISEVSIFWWLAPINLPYKSCPLIQGYNCDFKPFNFFLYWTGNYPFLGSSSFCVRLCLCVGGWVSVCVRAVYSATIHLLTLIQSLVGVNSTSVNVQLSMNLCYYSMYTTLPYLATPQSTWNTSADNDNNSYLYF